MIELANKKDCTGCMNCITVCRKNAITISMDSLDNIYPMIDKSKCIECGMCVNACPAMNSVELNFPNKCYAAYSTNPSIRHSSASGGVAATIYQECLEIGSSFTGVSFNTDSLTAKHRIGNTLEDIIQFSNSKYTYSFMDQICEEINRDLKKTDVCFIGLPCQVAAVRRYIDINNGDSKRLLTVDLVCHGVPSHIYLMDHLKNSVHMDRIESLSFRDNRYQTSKFVLSVSDSKRTYHKFVESNDNYQIGYHNATIYRPNCYNCYYARLERTGDVTISDFSGFGKIAPFEGDIKREQYYGVSCVLVNTEKGNALISRIIENGMLNCFERPLEEAIRYEQQLKAPSEPSRYRKEFERLYPQNGFTKTCNRVFRNEKIKRPVIKLAKDCAKFVLRRK